MRELATALALAMLAGCSSSDPVVSNIRHTAATTGEIIVRSPYALVPFTNSPMPAYLTIENRGGTADTLRQITVSGGFPSPGIHGASMDPLLELPIPGGSTVRLTPGGNHLMFEPPLPAVTRGDSLTFTLRFARSGAVVIQAYVVGYDEVDQLR